MNSIITRRTLQQIIIVKYNNCRLEKLQIRSMFMMEIQSRKFTFVNFPRKEEGESGMPGRQLSEAAPRSYARYLDQTLSLKIKRAPCILWNVKNQDIIPVEKQAGFGQRMVATPEISIENFPAGFGWQGASCSRGYGYGSNG